MRMHVRAYVYGVRVCACVFLRCAVSCMISREIPLPTVSIAVIFPLVIIDTIAAIGKALRAEMATAGDICHGGAGL
jgi:hypothetical protein